ncbi:hypothetical protein GCM10025858_21980 [Alicyclobacillus sacchari]|uniref:DedA family protein n=1 Tax=Alicyclobacillus sacchari TaxID=392010 RepID=UPI0023E97FAE|nr:hypothetical protein [Alicyclobacillus sacchari]GMA57695.1 hypothetical protein GCM10025858_21980 [Alicyclobacillus sacchari]
MDGTNTSVYHRRLVYLGYPGVFVAMVLEGLGLPFPGDVFLAFYGYSVAEHSMNGATVFCFGTLGYFSVSIVFLLTRRFESVLLRPLYQMRVLNEARLQSTADSLIAMLRSSSFQAAFCLASAL